MLNLKRFAALALLVMGAQSVDAQVLFGPAAITGGFIKGADVTGAMVTPTGGSRTTLGQALANGGGGVVVPTAPLLSGNGTTLGAVTAINAIPIGGTTPAAIAATTLSATSTTTTAGITDSGGIGTTSALGFQMNGFNAIRIVGGNSSDTVCGRGAAPNAPGGKLNTVCGDNAGANMSSLTGEMTLNGNIAGQYLGFDLSLNAPCAAALAFDTALGQHSLGYETCASSSTAVGNDDQRNVVSWGNSFTGNNSTVGKSAYQSGAGYNISGIGTGGLQGNSSAIVLSGAPTGTGTWTLTLTPGASTGLSPISVPVTVTNGESLAAIATAMVAALQSNTTYTTAYQALASVIDTSNIVLMFPGTSITGLSIVTTSASTATGTFAAAITGGFTGANIEFIGASSIVGNYATTANSLFGVGQDVLRFVTTAANDHCVGFNSCKSMQTLTGMDAYGSNVFKLATVGGNSFGAGTSAAAAATTVNGSVIISPAGLQIATNLTHVTVVGGGCMQSIASVGSGNTVVGSCDQSFGMSLSGTQNLVLGANAQVPTPSASSQVSIANSLICTGCSALTTSVVASKWGVNIKAPTAALTIGDGGVSGAGLGPHLAFVQTTLPTITNGTLDAQGSDSAGTVTEGTTVTGAVLTFVNSYGTAPHCSITNFAGNPTLVSLSAVTFSTLTVTNASATGNVFTYQCFQ
jgi:hypothetical protein